MLLIEVLTQISVPLQGDNGSQQLQEDSLGQCLQSSYPPCSYLERSLQSHLDPALEEAGTLPTHPLKPRKLSILVTEPIIGWRGEDQ